MAEYIQTKDGSNEHEEGGKKRTTGALVIKREEKQKHAGAKEHSCHCREYSLPAFRPRCFDANLCEI